jgi:hypothetical protein
VGLASVVGQDRDQRLTPAADARLAFGVGVACVVAFAVFVLAPYYATDGRLLPGPDALWALAGSLTLVLAPLAAGLAAWGSLVALWAYGDALPTTARRLHLVTLLLAAVLFAGLASAWGSGVVSWWTD